MSVMICHASLSENGTINGQKGDQTGREVCKRTWYSKPWNYVIRFTDKNMAEKVAWCMEKASDNNFIGYSQATRNTLLNESRKFNYDVSRVVVPVNCDCSSLVSVACMYAGIPESALTLNGNCATTRTLLQILKSTGEVEIFSTPIYVSKSDKLRRGDILLSVGHHVAVVVSVDENPYTLTATLLKEGSIGESVKWLQVMLNKNGANLDVDGQYGKLTKLSVILYQKEHGLVADGIVGQKTISALKSGAKKVSSSDTTEKHIWDFLMNKIGNAYGVAGLMGNLKAESNLNPKNLQNSFNTKFGMTDEDYTRKVDDGTYSHFVDDGAGYGLAQWTYKTRKQMLLNSKGNRSIGDLDLQLDFLWYELQTSYKGVLNGLKNATSSRYASDIVLTKFERPKDQSETVRKTRAVYAEDFLARLR